MRLIIALLSIIAFPDFSYGLTEEQKIILSQKVKTYQLAKNPSELISKFKFPESRRELLEFVKTNQIKALAKISKNGGVLEFYSGRAKLEIDFNKISEGEIVFNQGSPIDMKKIASFKEFWDLFSKAVRKTGSFSLLRLLIPFAEAEEENNPDTEFIKDKRKVVLSGGLFSWDLLDELHPCSLFKKAGQAWGPEWKEKCDHIDDEIPVEEVKKWIVNKVKRIFGSKSTQ